MGDQGKFSKLNAVRFEKRVKNKGEAIFYHWRALKSCIRHMKESNTKVGLEFWYHQAELYQCVIEGFFMNSEEFDAFLYAQDLSTTLLHLTQQYRGQLTK